MITGLFCLALRVFGALVVAWGSLWVSSYIGIANKVLWANGSFTLLWGIAIACVAGLFTFSKLSTDWK